MEKLCRIRDIQRSVIAFEQQFEKQYGISLNEGMLLCSLIKQEQLTSGELGELLGLTSSNMSKVIASAEKKELIERFICKEDKRQMRFSLTDKGRKLIEDIHCGSVETPALLDSIITNHKF